MLEARASLQEAAAAAGAPQSKLDELLELLRRWSAAAEHQRFAGVEASLAEDLALAARAAVLAAERPLADDGGDADEEEVEDDDAMLRDDEEDEEGEEMVLDVRGEAGG